MAKELPYFQFEPAEYLTKDISFCSLAAQGLFINLCSYYWQRECNLTKDQFLRRFKNETEFNELLTEGVIDVSNDGKMAIKFLDIQYDKATNQSRVNSINGSKGGRPRNPNKTETKPKLNPNKSETKGIREDKIKEDKNKVKNITPFEDALLEFTKMRKTLNKPLTDKAKKLIIDKLNKLAPNNEKEQIQILEQSIMNSWQGVFELKAENKQSSTPKGIAFG